MTATVTATLLAVIGFIVIFAPIKPFTDDITKSITSWATAPIPPGKATRGWAVSELDIALKITGAYFVLVAIGLFMKKPGEDEGKVSPLVDAPVKQLQKVYNLAQCILCTYMIWRAVDAYIKLGYVPICNTYNVERIEIASVLHIFYLSKILDFCDTLFIVLRQKWRQMSFLHIYHHASIFLVYWLNLVAGYDGDIYLTIVLNSFVHLVMYSYYFLTTFGYNAWWKNYITLLQMGQFLLMNVQAIYILVFGCPYPRNITTLYLIYIISLFLLFNNFYTKTYTKKPSEKKTR